MKKLPRRNAKPATVSAPELEKVRGGDGIYLKLGPVAGESTSGGSLWYSTHLLSATP
jgi:hypothetical protein